MDIGFITLTILLLIGTTVVKWKHMKNTSSKVLYFTIVGLIAVLIIFCVNYKAYSILNVTIIREMVMGMYNLMRGQGG
ncbi:hypothetical protein SAMN05216378_2001 [Paenibacillus catalpae]|uniref:Uncharacterized protein n=1 Tax=Paenibacillus catalpae TaxID=1045775 RepID=A0A1I1X437_9BACL|nr:hypothetical protein [Paenibacillus catalpae]SFE02112.1 hypothetical protein SAMN05216378_2001 [Paenibacillus catalpae]